MRSCRRHDELHAGGVYKGVEEGSKEPGLVKRYWTLAAAALA